eukprot:3102117-Pleurochrysis_carterae.AAC.1
MISEHSIKRNSRAAEVILVQKTRASGTCSRRCSFVGGRTCVASNECGRAVIEQMLHVSENARNCSEQSLAILVRARS